MKNQVAEAPTLSWGPKFLCETCCDQGVLQVADAGCVIFHCPEHMTLCIKDGEVLSFQSHGIRQ